jgi:DNA-binding response OmpR family regulator
MNTGARVLVVSRDQMLLQTRKLILGAFFEVEAAGRVPEAEAMMAEHTFDLIVLCYSLADDEYAKIVNLADRQDPKPKILTLNSAANHHSSRDVDGKDQVLMTESGPYALLKKASEMLGFRMKGTGRLAEISDPTTSAI